jgi:predicted RNA binding protein YcfA (HicA-like mRNA interferase family)
MDPVEPPNTDAAGQAQPFPRVSDFEPNEFETNSEAGSHNSFRDPHDNITTRTKNETVRIGTLDIEISEDADDSDIHVQVPLYPKESRDRLTEEKRNDLFNNAIKSQHSQAKYDFTHVDISSEKRLDDIYNISIMISKTKAAHLQYDMDNVFSIVFPINPGNKKLSPRDPVNLYTNYDEVTEQEVAASCDWYNRFPTKNYLWDTLVMSHKLLRESYPDRKKDRYYL